MQAENMMYSVKFFIKEILLKGLILNPLLRCLDFQNCNYRKSSSTAIKCEPLLHNYVSLKNPIALFLFTKTSNV
jgi:hypothetical protein